MHIIKGVFSGIKYVCKIILNFFFPPVCVFCGEVQEINNTTGVCERCNITLPFVENGTFCEKCGKPITGYGKKQRCYFCLNVRPLYFDRIVSTFEYKGVVKDSVQRFKGAGLESYVDVYSDYMTDTIKKQYEGVNPGIVCQVPSHKDKRRKQGFDNVEELAIAIAKKSGLPFKKNVLTKTRKTQKQTTLGYKQRLKNMQNSMMVKNPDAVVGKVVLLVDDVCTTRATIIECSRALKKAGARNVFAVTFATANKEKF